MILENIPYKLRPLIFLATKWGICDDGYRDEQIENATVLELQKFVGYFSDDIIFEFNEWLSNEEEIIQSSNEYVVFTCLFLAFEYANVVLEDIDFNSKTIN